MTNNREVIQVLSHITNSLSKAHTRPTSIPRAITKLPHTASQDNQEHQVMDLQTPMLKLRVIEA
jgi:hypothetical protein